MSGLNERQREMIEAIASWESPRDCGKTECGKVCKLLDKSARGTPLQQKDLLERTAFSFAADCELSGMWEGEEIHIFDMLELLHQAG